MPVVPGAVDLRHTWLRGLAKYMGWDVLDVCGHANCSAKQAQPQHTGILSGGGLEQHRLTDLGNCDSHTQLELQAVRLQGYAMGSRFHIPLRMASSPQPIACCCFSS